MFLLRFSWSAHLESSLCWCKRRTENHRRRKKNHIEWFDCKSVWRHFYSVFFVFFNFFAIEVTAHFDGDLSRGKFHISIKITVNLFTNDYGVWTEERASYLWRMNARNVQHPTELSFEHADRNASNNSCQLEMLERERERAKHPFYRLTAYTLSSSFDFIHINPLAICLKHAPNNLSVSFLSRKKMLCGFLCGDGNFTQLSFSYDQWLSFVAIVFSCWKKVDSHFFSSFWHWWRT